MFFSKKRCKVTNKQAKNKIRNKIFHIFAWKPPFILPVAGNFFGFASALLPAQQQAGQGGDVGN